MLVLLNNVYVAMLKMGGDIGSHLSVSTLSLLDSWPLLPQMLTTTKYCFVIYVVTVG